MIFSVISDPLTISWLSFDYLPCVSSQAWLEGNLKWRVLCMGRYRVLKFRICVNSFALNSLCFSVLQILHCCSQNCKVYSTTDPLCVSLLLLPCIHLIICWYFSINNQWSVPPRQSYHQAASPCVRTTSRFLCTETHGTRVTEFSRWSWLHYDGPDCSAKLLVA